MKKTVITSIALILFSLNIFAQDIAVAEPEFINSAIYVEAGKTHKLEKAIPFYKSRGTIGAYTLGIGGTKSFQMVNEPESFSRIGERDTYTFIIRVTSNEYDPAEAISIMKFETSRKRRKLTVASSDMFGQYSSGNMDYVPFEARKYGESSYLIRISRPIGPGEYAIAFRYASDVLNCFGIDG